MGWCEVVMYIFCAIEQYFVIGVSYYWITEKGHNPWWWSLTALMVLGASPTLYKKWCSKAGR